ncbi:MAG: TetR/AcrR family transcriptional regulator, partial [Acidimicrobiales bacterium]
MRPDRPADGSEGISATLGGPSRIGQCRSDRWRTPGPPNADRGNPCSAAKLPAWIRQPPKRESVLLSPGPTNPVGIRPVAPVQQRPSQDERSRTARAALLNATVACLVDGGLSRTTPTAVAHRAGLSLGALTHHYPTKVDLLGAAAEHVIQRRIRELQDATAALDPGRDLIDASVEALWAIFSGGAFVARVSLWIDARTHTELAAAVARVGWTFLETAEMVFSELSGEHAAYGNPLSRRVGLQ